MVFLALLQFGTFVGKSYDQMSKDELHQFETSAKLRQLILKKRRYEARFAERKRLVKMIERTLEEQSLTESGMFCHSHIVLLLSVKCYNSLALCMLTMQLQYN